MIWWVIIQKNGQVRLLSELTNKDVIIKATLEAKTIWEVHAENSWVALSQVMVMLMARDQKPNERNDTPTLKRVFTEALTT